MKRVYRRAPLPRGTLEDRLDTLKPFMNQGMDYFARNLVKHQDVSKLRLPPRPKVGKLSGDDLDDYLRGVL